MKRSVSDKLRKTLAKDHACYVLITCSEPDEEGQMAVDMTYEGDPTLAAYLLQGAQDYLDDIEEETDGPPFLGIDRHIN